MTIKLMQLRTRANRLEKLFNSKPRIFKRSDWEKLIRDYQKIGAESNVAHWSAKLANAGDLLRMEHTGMDPQNNTPPQLLEARDAPEELLYWTTRGDVK